MNCSLPIPIIRRIGALLLVACSSNTPDTGTSENDSVPDAVPDIPTTQCATGHDWLPTSDMGSIIMAERDPSLSLSRSVLESLLGGTDYSEYATVHNGVETWRVRYLTQDRGVETEATGFVFLPDIEEPESVPILLYTHPLMGFTDGCAPTAQGLEGAAIPLLMSATGMVVAAPDYLGMRGFGEASTEIHPAILAEPTAVVSLDNLRAAVRLAASESSNAHPDPSRTLLWGASEGGFAALWSDRYQSRYAPEFETLGVVAAIPPTDMLALARLATTIPSESTAALAATLIGMDQWYDYDDLDGVLHTDLVDVLPQEMLESCNDFPSVTGRDEIDELFDSTFVTAASAGNWDAIEPWSCFLEESSLVPSRIPYESEAPVLVITAENDDLAWPEPVHADIPRLCDAGYRIEHVQCADSTHVSGAIDTLPYQLDWLNNRIEGSEPATDCTVSEPIDCDDL